VTLRREALPVPEKVGEGNGAVAPFRAGETLRWRLAETG
jgi:dihydroorotase